MVAPMGHALSGSVKRPARPQGLGFEWSQALDHASPRRIVDEAPPPPQSVSLQASVLVPGKFNAHDSISRCPHVSVSSLDLA